KSGVDGGIMVVVPGQLGIGVYSAPLDSHGNSVRGAAAIRRVTRDLGLHYADAPPLGGSTLRAHYSLADASLGVEIGRASCRAREQGAVVARAGQEKRQQNGGEEYEEEDRCK